jgi:hypothetical protein
MTPGLPKGEDVRAANGTGRPDEGAPSSGIGGAEIGRGRAGKISRAILAAVLVVAPRIFAAEPVAAGGRMTLTFEADAAVATGVTPGAAVAWLGVSRAREEWTDHFYHWRQTTEDSGKAGVARYPRKEGFPQQTILVAIDLASGAWAVGATYPLGADVPGPVLENPSIDSTGLLTSFTHRGRKVDILVARAGGQAWAARILDGSPLDQDGASNGMVTVGLATLPWRVGKAEALDGVRPGDIIAMVDDQGPSARVARFGGNAAGKE